MSTSSLNTVPATLDDAPVVTSTSSSGPDASAGHQQAKIDDAGDLKISPASPLPSRGIAYNLSSTSTQSVSPPSTVAPSAAPIPVPRKMGTSSLALAETTAAPAAVEAKRQSLLDNLTKERNEVLDRWADPRTLGLTTQEIKINTFLKNNLRFLFGQTGFDPPVNARNPVSVSMHNPRFSAALWALNTEAYRRRGTLTRSQKEVVALGISLSNQCPHCAFIHAAMGPAAGSDVKITQMQTMYHTRDADVAFPPTEDQESMLHKLAKWSLGHRDADPSTRYLSAPRRDIPEILGTMMLFEMLNRTTDAFVSQDEAGPMFPLPFRFFMRFTSVAPMIQRMMSAMMSWMMYGEDAKIPAGAVLKDINKITPIVKGYHGASNEAPLELPVELSWAGTDSVIGPTVAFVAAEAELMAWTHIPDTVTPYMRYWVSRWDGGMVPSVSRETWLDPAVNGWINLKERSKSEADGDDDDEEDNAALAMLKLMIVVVVASYSVDDNLLSECQSYHGLRATHAAVHWAAFVAAQRATQLAFTKPVACSS